MLLNTYVSYLELFGHVGDRLELLRVLNSSSDKEWTKLTYCDSQILACSSEPEIITLVYMVMRIVMDFLKIIWMIHANRNWNTELKFSIFSSRYFIGVSLTEIHHFMISRTKEGGNYNSSLTFHWDQDPAGRNFIFIFLGFHFAVFGLLIAQ